MANDYIRVKTLGNSNNNGFKIIASIVTNFSFTQGIDSVDLSLPTSTERKVVPISGLKLDPVFQIELIADGTNKAFSIDNIGNETALGVVTTADQVNFILDNMSSPNLGAHHIIYLDWLGRTFGGTLQIRGQATGDEFFNKVTLVATMKIGTNILGL